MAKYLLGKINKVKIKKRNQINNQAEIKAKITNSKFSRNPFINYYKQEQKSTNKLKEF